MDDIIATRTIGAHFAEVKDDFVLTETSTTKIVFRAQLHPRGIRGEILRYKKGKNGECIQKVPVDFRKLHENEGISIELSTEAVGRLYEGIEKLACILREKGVRYGEHEFTVTDISSLPVTEANKGEIIQKLLEAGVGEDFWNSLTQWNPDMASRIVNAQINAYRASVVRQFAQMLNNDGLSESDWQKFFEMNTWIFGYGLRYQVLRIVQAQPNYGGTTITGTGGQRGDFLAGSDAEAAKFTCLVEIKKPTTPLLQNKEYRNEAWGISNELAGAVAQIHTNCAQWEISGSRTDQNRELLEDYSTVEPKGIVVVGRTSQLDTRAKKHSFERFRREIHNPEIITFDELYKRTLFILGEYISPNEDEC